MKYFEFKKGSLTPKLWKYDHGILHRDTHRIRFPSRSSQFIFHDIPCIQFRNRREINEKEYHFYRIYAV